MLQKLSLSLHHGERSVRRSAQQLPVHDVFALDMQQNHDPLTGRSGDWGGQHRLEYGPKGRVVDGSTYARVLIGCGAGGGFAWAGGLGGDGV